MTPTRSQIPFCNPFEQVQSTTGQATTANNNNSRRIEHDAKQQSEDKIKLTRKLSNQNKYGAIGDNKKQQQPLKIVSSKTANQPKQQQQHPRLTARHRIKYWAFWWLARSLAIWALVTVQLSSELLEAAPAAAIGMVNNNGRPTKSTTTTVIANLDSNRAQLPATTPKRVITVKREIVEQQLNGEYLENKPALGDYDKRYDKLDEDINTLDALLAGDSSAAHENYLISEGQLSPYQESTNDKDSIDHLMSLQQQQQHKDNDDNSDNDAVDNDNNNSKQSDIDSSQQLKRINARYLNEAFVSRRRKRQANDVVGQINMRAEQQSSETRPAVNEDNQVDMNDLISVDDLREVIEDELRQWLEQQRLVLLDNAKQSLSKKATTAATSIGSLNQKKPLKPEAIWLNDALMQLDTGNENANDQLATMDSNLDNSSNNNNNNNNNENTNLFDKSYDEFIANSKNNDDADEDGLDKRPRQNPTDSTIFYGEEIGKEEPEEDDESQVQTGQVIEEKLDDEFMPMHDSDDNNYTDSQGLEYLASGAGSNRDSQVWIQRRRLNRDRALEPAPGQRQQPMRRRDDGDFFQLSQQQQQQQLSNESRNNKLIRQEQHNKPVTSISDQSVTPVAEVPVLISGDQENDNSEGQREDTNGDNMLLLETLADNLARKIGQSSGEKRDSQMEANVRARSRPFGRPLIQLRGDEQDQLNSDDETATIVNPIITRPKEIADEYNERGPVQQQQQQMQTGLEDFSRAMQNSNDNHPLSINRAAINDDQLTRKRWRNAASFVGAGNDKLSSVVGQLMQPATVASGRFIGQTYQNDEQQLDNLEEIDADLARIRTTSISPRKRSMMQQLNDNNQPGLLHVSTGGNALKTNTDATDTTHYYGQSEPNNRETPLLFPFQNNNANSKNRQQTWRHPMLDLASYVEARSQQQQQRQQQPNNNRLKWRRSYQQQQQQQQQLEKPLVSVLQYRSISAPRSPFLSQAFSDNSNNNNINDDDVNQSNFQMQPMPYAFPIPSMLLNGMAANSNLMDLEPPNSYAMYPFLSAPLLSNSKQLDSRLFIPQQQQQQSPMTMINGDYQRSVDVADQLQRRRMSDLLEIALDLPRGAIMDIGLNNRQNVVVKINPIYLSDAKISELTSKYDTIIGDPVEGNVGIMTISKWDALFGDTPEAPVLNFATKQPQKQSSIILKSHARQLMTQTTGAKDNQQQGALATLMEEHHEKLRLMSLTIAFLLAILVTIVIIKYTGLIMLVRRKDTNNTKKHSAAKMQLSSSEDNNSSPTETTGKTNFLFRADHHQCSNLRAKCNNLCSYARSAYGGLQNKAYKSFHSSPEEANDLIDDNEHEKQQAVISGTFKGEASPDNNQQACTKCSSPTTTNGHKELATHGHLDTRRSSSNSSTKSLITGTSQSTTINGHQWGANADDEPIVTSNMDIIAAHMILSYMEEHLKDKDRVKRDWRELCSYEADLKSTNCAQMSENRAKNRNQNALAYDHSRVKLMSASSHAAMMAQQKNSTSLGKQLEQHSKYINANFIYDDDPKRATHIITQAPLRETVADFWQMVWEQGCSVIVMLTRLSENGLSLCHCYWPMESRNHQVYGDFEIHLVSEHICCQDYLVRNIYLMDRRSLETRTITQFHYLSWPDQLIPSNINKFLEFRRKVNKCYRISSSPIVVHCSDGTGRSGTYTLIDMVLNRISKGAKEIDIAATLEHLRDQRMGMVNNETQFEFVLAAVAEEIQAILKALPQ